MFEIKNKKQQPFSEVFLIKNCTKKLEVGVLGKDHHDRQHETPRLSFPEKKMFIGNNC